MKQKRLIAPTKFRAISPAQDFINNIAYFTVSLYQEDQKTAKIVQLVITSKKDCFQLTTENLNKLSLFSDYNPRPKPRWSDHSIEKYLKGNETSDLSKTFHDVKEQLDFYIDFGDAKWSSVIALWIIGTYFFQLFNSYPYVHLNGNMASGKTKTLNIISQLAFNAELTTNSTPAYLARMINDNSATCCIDETESLQRARDEDSRTILGMYNSGYKKGSRMGKLQQKGDSKDWIPVEFNSYSPKVFAGINGLENSLASRCIPITMVRSANANLKNREITENNHLLSDIRDELYVTALDNFSIINAIYQGITDNKLVGRDCEFRKPI
jgi:hypothetical protein